MDRHINEVPWEQGNSKHVCAQWDGMIWALAERGIGQRLLLFFMRGRSEFASVFYLGIICSCGFNCWVLHLKGHGMLLCPLLSTVGASPGPCLAVAPASHTQNAAASRFGPETQLPSRKTTWV